MRTPDGGHAELLLYYTDLQKRRKRADQTVHDDELTPIVIEDGVLVGWGWSYLEQDEQKYSIWLYRR